MTSPPPRLITFGISHYCEKARWALDWHGIACEERSWPPAVHIPLARLTGAKRSTLPILLVGDRVIQGSGEIIDWAERNADGAAPALSPQGDARDATAIERRADHVIGPQVRRLFYAEMLPRHHRMVKPALFSNTTPGHRLLGEAMWPVTLRIIRRAYDATAQTAPDARARLDAELDWLDAKLADGRRFLADDRFGRADITVASLLAIFARPEQTPLYHDMSLPPALADDVARWHERPIFKWVRSLYKTNRTSR